MITGTSIPTVPGRHLSLHTNGWETTIFSPSATVRSRLSLPRRHRETCTTPTQGTSCRRATVESLRFAEQPDHGDLPLRHDRIADDLWNSHDLHNGDVNHRVEEQLGISMINQAAWTMKISLCSTTRKSTTLLIGCNFGKSAVFRTS